MNVSQLQAVFKANEVPHAYYSFRGMAAGDCYVLEQIDGVWQTYYSERGSRYEDTTYQSEDQACRAMFSLVAEMMLSSRKQVIDMQKGPQS